MKILCETNVTRRNNPQIKGKFLKSTIAIGKKDEKSNLCLILITSSNKSGTKYDLTNNIANIFRKFIDDGKCTISFKLPEVDLQIKSDPINLKAFLNQMKSQLCPHQTTKEPLRADNKMLRAFGSTPKMIDQITKMTIYERSQFPIKGFPRTVKELTISGIGNSSMPIGILNLTNLSFLDLSKNQITKLHKSLGNLRLTKLVLSDNKFGESNNINDWDWMNGENIRRSLVTLNLSNNQLKSTPAKLFMFTELTNLDLSSNEISKLPHAIKQMKQLRIINLSKNLLKTFPYTITKLQLDSVDLSSNHLPTYQKCFEIIRESHQNLNELNFRAPTLLELAARQIIKKQIPFMHHNIPLILKDILIYSPLCSNSKCELLCFDMKILQNVNLIRLRANTIISSNFEKHFVADGPFCSRSCQLAVTKNLFRNN